MPYVMTAPGRAEYYHAEPVTGDGTASLAIDGVNMSAGGLFIWKSLSAAQNAYMAMSPDGINVYSFEPAGTGIAATTLVEFTSTGVVIKDASINVSGRTYIAYTMRRMPRFLDVMYYAGSGSNQQIAHTLAKPGGMAIWRELEGGNACNVYWRSDAPTTRYTWTTAGATTGDAALMNSTDPDSSVLYLGNSTNTNESGKTYCVALFAHDTAIDGVVQVLGYTGTGAGDGPAVVPGWLPRFILLRTRLGSNAGVWPCYDNTRGIAVGNDKRAVLGSNASENTVVDDIEYSGSTGWVGKNTAMTNLLLNGLYQTLNIR